MSLMKKLLSLMVISLLSLGVMGCMSESEKEELLGYLEEKYGGKYELVKYWTENDGTSKLSHQMLVHPEGEPEHLFKAGKFWDPTEKKDVLWDNRVEAKWSVDFTEKHRNLITSLDSRSMEVKFQLGVAGEPGVNFLETNMEDYLDDQQGEDAKPAAIVGIAIKCESEPDKKQDAELAFKIYRKLQSLGFSPLDVEVAFVKAKSFGDATKLMKIYHADSFTSLRDLGSNNYYYLLIGDEDSINTPADIENEFVTGE